MFRIYREGNQRDRELPVIRRDVDPIYAGKDNSIFEELLLGSGMGEKEYLKLSAEYHDKTPNDWEKIVTDITMDEARPVSQRDVTGADGIAPYCEYTNITDMWCDSSQQDKKKEEK